LSLLTFIETNRWLVLVFVVSGGMLLWPLVQKRFGPAKEIGTLQMTRLLNDRNTLVLDVRETKEYEGGRLPNAVHVPISQLASRGSELAGMTDRPVVMYCARGQRSMLAARALAKLGFKEIYSLRGGINAWRQAGLPVTK
jgi:rhodanese-related sulfurtransferase